MMYIMTCAIVPVLTYRPRVFFPIDAYFTLIIKSPLSRDEGADLLRLIPEDLVGVLYDVTARAIGAMLLGPL